MSAITTSLSKSLPKPKYSGEDEELPLHTQQRGPRIVGAGTVDDSQVVVRRKGPPPYGQRTGWRPRSQEDYGDGGAFPEIPVAQYPLDMGRKTTSSSNALAIQVDESGKVKYDAIARRGHDEKRGALVQASFKDLIPLRQQANAGELSLSRPSEEQVAEAKERTANALAKLVSGAVAAQKPKNVKGISRNEPTYVRYTPANQMGDTSKKQDRIIKIVERQQDPMEPPKFKHKKIPRGPPSPPPPVLHSPPRKHTAEEQEAWKIPPPVSNWKNPKGFTVPLDKRLAADGRGLQDVTINDKFSQFAEALYTADRHAREEVKQRAMMQQRLAEKEKMQKEDQLRALAQKARDERNEAAGGASSSRDRHRRSRRHRDSRDSRSRSRSMSSYSSSYSSRSRSRDRDRGDDSDSGSDRGAREREELRRERRREDQRQMRQSRMGHERKLQMMAREQGRDISERIALGTAKPSAASGEGLYDSRLFNRSSGFASGFNEDQPYDKPLFAAQEAISQIYKPNLGGGGDDDDDGDGDAAMDRITRASRFEELGRAKEGFKGAAEAEQRSGPVQFEKERDPDTVGGGEKDDPFGIGNMISEVQSGMSGKGKGKTKRGYGMQAGRGRDGDDDDDGRDAGRSSKRPRVDSDSD